MKFKTFNDIKIFVISYRNEYEKKQIEKRLRNIIPIVNECKNNPNFKEEVKNCKECEIMRENMVSSWCKKHSPNAGRGK